jgi:hypothetical protein
MTKKSFKEMVSYHPYRGYGTKGFNALFFDWKSEDINGKYIVGFKYCLWARTENATKKELEDTLYDYITGKITDNEIPWYMQLAEASIDQQRFKVPLGGKSLNSMVNHYINVIVLMVKGQVKGIVTSFPTVKKWWDDAKYVKVPIVDYYNEKITIANIQNYMK